MKRTANIRMSPSGRMDISAKLVRQLNIKPGQYLCVQRAEQCLIVSVAKHPPATPMNSIFCRVLCASRHSRCCRCYSVKSYHLACDVYLQRGTFRLTAGYTHAHGTIRYVFLRVSPQDGKRN